MDASRLAAIPLFADLPDEDLAVIASLARETDADEGATLVTEGDLGYALYAIESGTATVSTIGVQLARLGPGDVFGEMAALGSGRRIATVVATSPMKLISLLNRDVSELEQRAPELTTRLRILIGTRRTGGSS